jgi:hypothetical protein
MSSNTLVVVIRNILIRILDANSRGDAEGRPRHFLRVGAVMASPIDGRCRGVSALHFRVLAAIAMHDRMPHAPNCA